METIKKTSLWLFASLISALSLPALAAPPVAEDAADGTGVEDGLWAYITAHAQDIILFAVPLVLGCVLLWFMWELAAKVLEQRKSREPEWGGVVAFGGFTAGYFVVAMGLSFLVLNMFV